MSGKEMDCFMLAVDVVMLPEGRVADKAIELNGRLVGRFGAEIVLGKERCLPHISLAMGCIEEGDIGAAAEALQEIGGTAEIGVLEITGAAVNVNSRGEKVSALEVVRSEGLMRLHTEIMERMGHFFKGEARPEYIAGAGDVAETTLEWINSYREKASFERFRPHITLGYGGLEEEAFGGKFRAERLALCHLGNHCTCVKVLWETTIKIREVGSTLRLWIPAFAGMTKRGE
jgi:2'-5' RNA ligase